MKSFRLALALVLSLFMAGAALADWRKDLKTLLKMKPGKERKLFLARILDSDLKWREVRDALENTSFKQIETGKLFINKSVCSDGVARPWILYTPPTYDSRKKTPLLISLHGGVTKSDIAPNIKDYARENIFTNIAKAKGWLVLYPFGQREAAWWDEVGVKNVQNLVREIKQVCNVDDNRVWMSGFSDGASGVYYHAMTNPGDYGAFVALNGHPGVGGLSSREPLYATNLYNSHIFAVSTDNDFVYPTRKISPIIALANRAGANIFYKRLKGRHAISYSIDELPDIVQYLTLHPRNPFPLKIVCEASDPEIGKMSWFSLEKIKAGAAQSWHKDYNMMLEDDRILIGIMVDVSYRKKGVRISSVPTGDSFANSVGLKAGDIITCGNKICIETMEDLTIFKRSVNRGGIAKLTVIRGKKKINLEGKFPAAIKYRLFNRYQPSALAKISVSANNIDIEASRLGAFRIKIHPGMFNLDQNIVIRVNEKVIHDAKVAPDLCFLLKNFLKNRDRSLIYVTELKVEL